MSEDFNNSEVCLKNKGFLFHNTVIIVCCGPCRLLKPNYIELIVKISKHSKALSISSYKVIKIKKSPISIKLIPPTKRRNLATQIPIIPNFKLSYAGKKRQIVDYKLLIKKIEPFLALIFLLWILILELLIFIMIIL